MAMMENANRYSRTAVSIHWITAFLIVALLISGNRIEAMEENGPKAQLLMIHAPIGILVGVLTLFRIVWWMRFDTRPEPVETAPMWQERLARGVHVLFYILILGMITSGMGMMVLSGAGEILFGGVDRPLPDFEAFLPRVPHGIGAKVIVGLLVLHAGAAMYHHFGLKDGLLKRMWF